MKRAMNLIRLLLLETEGEDPNPTFPPLQRRTNLCITPRCSSKPVWSTG